MMDSPGSALSTDVESPLPSTSLPERVGAGLMAGALLFMLGFHLVPTFLMGFLVYSLMHHVGLGVRSLKLSSGKHARWWALGVLSLVALVLTGLGLWGFAWLWRARESQVPELLTQMAQVLERTRHGLGDRFIPEAFTDADTLGEAVTDLLRDHAEALKAAGNHAGHALAHSVAGLLLGILAAFHTVETQAPARPLSEALAQRMGRLLGAFEAVVFAQVRISALNTGLTAFFLYAVLPLFHVHLPLRPTLVAVTFAAGLLPVVGNLLSNSAIVLISLGVGPGVGLASLVYLVVVHKVEYVLNARIVGSRIAARPWEVLLAMVLMEAAFGLPGLVVAPILYAYAKGEFAVRGWV